MNLLIVIIALGILIALHETGHFLVARLVGMRVLRFSVGFWKPLFSHTSAKSGIEYRIGLIPLGGYVQIKGMNPFEEGVDDEDSYHRQPVWKRAAVIVAGPLANLLVAFLILVTIVAGIGLPNPVDRAEIGAVTPHWPAAKAGLVPGDRIIRVGDKVTDTWTQLATILHSRPNMPTVILVERAGRRFSVSVTPKDRGGIGQIGILPPSERVKKDLIGAVRFAAHKCAQVLTDALGGLWGMVSGAANDVQAVGPPGIVKMAAAQLKQGFVDFLAFLSYISLMLFLFNLLPIPALDGGRTVFLLYELVTRKRVNKRFDAVLNYFFFILLMGFVAIISIKELFFQ